MRPEQLLTHPEEWIRRIAKLIPTTFLVTSLHQTLIHFENQKYLYIIKKYMIPRAQHKTRVSGLLDIWSWDLCNTYFIEKYFWSNDGWVKEPDYEISKRFDRFTEVEKYLNEAFTNTPI